MEPTLMIPHISDLNTIGNDTFVAEGTYGYGDIVGATAYACKNHYRKICFVWFTNRKWSPPDNKYHINDPESILERTDFIVRKMSKTMRVSHVLKDGEIIRPYHTYRQRYYDTLYPFLDRAEDHGHIALWTTKYNIDDIHSHSTAKFKDPIHHDDVMQALTVIDAPIEFVSYRDPIRNTFERIRTASVCIGYEGIGQLIAKNYYKPTITFSRGNISKCTTGEWGLLTDTLDDRLLNLEQEILRQSKLIKNLKGQ